MNRKIKVSREFTEEVLTGWRWRELWGKMKTDHDSVEGIGYRKARQRKRGVGGTRVFQTCSETQLGRVGWEIRGQKKPTAFSVWSSLSQKGCVHCFLFIALWYCIPHYLALVFLVWNTLILKKWKKIKASHRHFFTPSKWLLLWKGDRNAKQWRMEGDMPTYKTSERCLLEKDLD